ncbi:MAG: type II toxin-antitoxin system VapC family toxin [Bdellovibrionota bacterium]
MVVDSSVFLEILSDGPLRSKCERAIDGKEVVVPTLVLFEIYRKLKSRTTEDDALSAIAALRQFRVADLTAETALLAGDLSLEHSLPMADSFVLAHAMVLGLKLVTLDNDFNGIDSAIVLR